MFSGGVKPDSVGRKPRHIGMARTEPWERTEARIKANWESLRKIGVASGGTIEHEGLQFKSDYISFTLDQVVWKGSRTDPGAMGLERYGIKVENLYKVTSSHGDERFLLLYDVAEDGSIRIHRSPEEHPAYAEAMEFNRERIARAADSQFQVLTAPEARSHREMSGARIPGVTRFAESSETWENAHIGDVIADMHESTAMQFVRDSVRGAKPADGYPGNLTTGERQGEEPMPLIRSDLMMKALENSPFHGDERVADMIADKAGFVRLHIEDKGGSMGGGAAAEITLPDGNARPIKMPFQFSQSGSADYYIPREHLEKYGFLPRGG